jgi:hypothetical protein
MVERSLLFQYSARGAWCFSVATFATKETGTKRTPRSDFLDDPMEGGFESRSGQQRDYSNSKIDFKKDLPTT